MPAFIGIRELLLLMLVLLLLFGAKRVPEMGRSLGRGMREFKDGILGREDNDDQTARSHPPVRTNRQRGDLMTKGGLHSAEPSQPAKEER